MKFLERLRWIFFNIFITISLAIFLLITIGCSRNVLQKNRMGNATKMDEDDMVESFLGLIYFFHLFCFFLAAFIHLFLHFKSSSNPHRTKSAFFREFGGIFDNDRCSSPNPLVDYVLKTCLLCLLWYLSTYLMLRSMSILISSQLIILYSITISLREVLGWIFLHELFIGNKIIGHILALSGLLLLTHNDGFRLNRYLFGLMLITLSVISKGIFDIVVNAFVKELTSRKLRIVMINICFCGTCLLWPFVLLFHVTDFERILFEQFYSLTFLIAFTSALIYNLFLIVIPIESMSKCYLLSFIIVIPTMSLIDQYYYGIKHSSLVISAMICSFSSVCLSLIPKQWFQTNEHSRMKQAFALLSKDSTIGTMNNGGTTSTTFDQIRAQRRLRNALLYNEIKI